MVIETGIALILIFGVLVMFHELGHFLAARAFKVRVEEFAFGFGPRLFRLMKLGDTEYNVRAFPLGGFVRTAGMDPGQEDIDDGYQAAAAWKRAVIVFAGPFASFLLAVVIFVLVGYVWGFPHDWKTANRIGMVSPQTVAQQIDLRAGDVIKSVNGIKVSSGNDMIKIIHGSAGKPVELSIDRKGQSIEKTAVPRYFYQWLDANWSFMKGDTAEVSGVMASDKQKLEKGDLLISVNGSQIKNGVDMKAAIEKAGGKPTSIVVKRGGKNVAITATPKYYGMSFLGIQRSGSDLYVLDDRMKGEAQTDASKLSLHLNDKIIAVNGNKVGSIEDIISLEKSGKLKAGRVTFSIERDGEAMDVTGAVTKSQLSALGPYYYDQKGLLGFMPDVLLVKASFSESLERGLKTSWLLVRMILYSLAPSRISENVGGPVMIAQQTSTMLSLGLYHVVQMAASLSLSLAVINMLPIPIVDGGHLVIMAIEGIRRRRFTPQQMQFATVVGFAFLITVFITVFWMDLFKIAHGLVPQ